MYQSFLHFLCIWVRFLECSAYILESLLRARLYLYSFTHSSSRSSMQRNGPWHALPGLSGFLKPWHVSLLFVWFQSRYLVDAIKFCCHLEMSLGWSLGRQLQQPLRAFLGEPKKTFPAWARKTEGVFSLGILFSNEDFSSGFAFLFLELSTDEVFLFPIIPVQMWDEKLIVLISNNYAALFEPALCLQLSPCSHIFPHQTAQFPHLSALLSDLNSHSK